MREREVRSGATRLRQARGASRAQEDPRAGSTSRAVKAIRVPLRATGVQPKAIVVRRSAASSRRLACRLQATAVEAEASAATEAVRAATVAAHAAAAARTVLVEARAVLVAATVADGSCASAVGEGLPVIVKAAGPWKEKSRCLSTLRA